MAVPVPRVHLHVWNGGSTVWDSLVQWHSRNKVRGRGALLGRCCNWGNAQKDKSLFTSPDAFSNSAHTLESTPPVEVGSDQRAAAAAAATAIFSLYLASSRQTSSSSFRQISAQIQGAVVDREEEAFRLFSQGLLSSTNKSIIWS